MDKLAIGSSLLVGGCAANTSGFINAIYWLVGTLIFFTVVQVVIIVIRCRRRNVRIQSIINKYKQRESNDVDT